jgi:hypothetical protein
MPKYGHLDYASKLLLAATFTSLLLHRRQLHFAHLCTQLSYRPTCTRHFVCGLATPQPRLCWLIVRPLGSVSSTPGYQVPALPPWSHLSVGPNISPSERRKGDGKWWVYHKQRVGRLTSPYAIVSRQQRSQAHFWHWVQDSHISVQWKATRRH